MKTPRIIHIAIFLGIFIISTCSNRPASPTPTSLNEASRSKDHSIYEFMEFVISDRKLDLDHGLQVVPCSLSITYLTDRELLCSLLEKAPENIPNNTSSTETPHNQSLSKRCLSQQDINEMLA